MKAIAVTLALLSATPVVQAAELRIEGTELAQVVERTFAGTIIRLDRDKPTATGNPIPGCSVQLGPQLQNQRFVFSVPEQRFSLGLAGHAVFEVNDINSNPAFVTHAGNVARPMGQNIAVSATRDAWIVTLRFEDEGTEILGRPIGKLERLRNGVVPNVEINNIRVQVELRPLAGRPTFAFQPARVTFLGDIQAAGLGDVTILGHHFDLFNQMTDYKAQLKAAIERELTALINRNLGNVATTVQREIVRRGAAMGVRVTGMRFDGTSLVIHGEPAAL